MRFDQFKKRGLAGVYGKHLLQILRMQNLSNLIFINKEDDGQKSWSPMNNSLMDTFTTSSNINISSINNLKNTTGNSEGPEQIDVDLTWYMYILIAIGIIIACFIVCVTVKKIVDCIQNGKVRKRILVPSFCTKCFRYAQRKKSRDSQRTGNDVEMQILDGSQGQSPNE